MTTKKLVQVLSVVAIFAACLPGQTVSSSLQGTVVDPANAIVPGAAVLLTNSETGATRATTTDGTGLFRFLDLSPDTYSVTVKAPGFKNFTQNTIIVAANETRELGKSVLTIGSGADTITVTAEAAAIQLASSEKATAIDGGQLSNVTLRGRDIFGYLKLVPGVIDNSYGTTNAGNRDVTSPNAIRGITINGNTSALNFTVDGISDMDTGSNTTIHYEPNADAVQEMKVLTSNYQAEFGRNSGGTITVVTKNGTSQFHGSMVWNHRNEGLNANLWQNNRNGRNAAGVPNSYISPYRFNVETYTIGGPIYIPHHFNSAKNKLFFFWSQEYTGQFVTGGVQNKYTPTALERGGNFSQSLQNNGTLTAILDPTNNNSPFPGNIIPTSRITPVGQAMLNFFPLPNFAGAGSQANIVNYTEAASATHPRRNDVLRVDINPTNKLNGYFRYINDHDDQIALYQGVQFSSGTGGTLGSTGIAPIDHPNPGHGYGGTVTYSFSPSLINEFTVGKSWNTWSYYTTDGGKSEDRSLVPNTPSLFPLPTTAPTGASPTNGYYNLLPQFQFGTVSGGSAMSFARNGTSAGNYENFNTIWTFTDNLSKVIGRHSLKFGGYIENNHKIQPSTPAYAGNYNFSPDSLNSLNTGNGYANALLGYVDSYSQATGRAVFNVGYWNAEWYAQDNWRVNSRLTLDIGLRFYHQTPQADGNNTFSNFVPSNYTKSAAPRLYIPGTSAGKRVAIDPGTGAVAPVAYIGLYVPNSGSPADGFQVLGANGVSTAPFTQKPVALAPRFGFAYDLTGDGKTALRGGFGIFYNRLDGNQVYNLSGQPPLVYAPQVNYTTFSSIAASGNSLVFGPATLYMWPNGTIPFDRAQNASLNIQRSITRNMVGEVGYTGNWGYNQQLSYDINALPIGTRAPFNAAAADATNSNKTLPDVLLRTVYPGFNTVNGYAHLGHTNYHALTASLAERMSNGLTLGAAYTFSRAMGTTTYTPVVSNNEAWNYGRLGFDRRQNLQVNFSYQIPGLGAAMHSKILGAVMDHWTLSGIFSMQSGAPFNPGGPNLNGTAPDYTGTPNVGARVNVVGDPMANVPAGLYYNPSAFAVPALGSTITKPVLGNLGGGSGVLSLPMIKNIDMTMSKFIPLFGERRGVRLQAQAYNVINHPEYNGVGTGLTWDANGNQTSLSAGVFNSTLPARVMAFSARIEF